MEVLTDDLPSEPPVEVIVCVVNALMLQCNLFLVSQLLELGKPLVVVLNMIDSARSRGVSIDVDRLSSQLGVPVVCTSASKREGIGELKRVIKCQLEAPGAATRDRVLPDSFYRIRDGFRQSLAENTAGRKSVNVEASVSRAPGDSSPGDSLTGSVCAGRCDDRLPDDYLIERMLLDRGGESERRMLGQLGAEAHARSCRGERNWRRRWVIRSTWNATLATRGPSRS